MDLDRDDRANEPVETHIGDEDAGGDRSDADRAFCQTSNESDVRNLGDGKTTGPTPNQFELACLLLKTGLSVLCRAETVFVAREAYETINGRIQKGRPKKGETIAHFYAETYRLTGIKTRALQIDLQIAEGIHQDARRAYHGKRVANSTTLLRDVAKLREKPELQIKLADHADDLDQFKAALHAFLQPSEQAKPDEPRYERITLRLDQAITLGRGKGSFELKVDSISGTTVTLTVPKNLLPKDHKGGQDLDDAQAQRASDSLGCGLDASSGIVADVTVLTKAPDGLQSVAVDVEPSDGMTELFPQQSKAVDVFGKPLAVINRLPDIDFLSTLCTERLEATLLHLPKTGPHRFQQILLPLGSDAKSVVYGDLAGFVARVINRPETGLSYIASQFGLTLADELMPSIGSILVNVYVENASLVRFVGVSRVREVGARPDDWYFASNDIHGTTVAFKGHSKSLGQVGGRFILGRVAVAPTDAPLMVSTHTPPSNVATVDDIAKLDEKLDALRRDIGASARGVPPPKPTRDDAPMYIPTFDIPKEQVLTPRLGTLDGAELAKTSEALREFRKGQKQPL